MYGLNKVSGYTVGSYTLHIAVVGIQLRSVSFVVLEHILSVAVCLSQTNVGGACFESCSLLMPPEVDRGYDFTPVCLFVSRISQKVVDRLLGCVTRMN